MITDPAPALPAYTEEQLAALSAQALIETLIGDEDRAPRNLIDHCAARAEKMVELLRSRNDDECTWKPEISRGEWWLLFHAPMILGLIASESAGLLLVRLMRRMSIEEEDDIQDWLAGDWPYLFANKPRSAIEAARALTEERSLGWYMRCQAMEIVIDTAMRDTPTMLDREIDWLAALAGDESEDWDVRLCACNMLLDFPRERHRKLLSDMARQEEERTVQGQWGGMCFSSDDIDSAFTRGGDIPGWIRRGEPWRFYAPGAIAARQDRWAEEDARSEKNEREGDYFPELDDGFPDKLNLPYLREHEKIGRNDPCHCGSGKKYKKCCLPKEQA